MNQRPYLRDRLISEHPDGFYVIVPRDAEPAVPLSCPVCHRLMRSQDDEAAWHELNCCHWCSMAWAAPRRKAWLAGWRPDSEKLAYEISQRPPLVVNLEVD